MYYVVVVVYQVKFAFWGLAQFASKPLAFTRAHENMHSTLLVLYIKFKQAIALFC